MYKWVLFVILIGAFTLGIAELFVQANAHKAPLDTVAAEAVYKQSCISCHGGNLEGGAGPALSKIGATLAEIKIVKQITNGGGIMPPFKATLKDTEIANLAKWLAAKK
jgi:mono/diheme cytochrome c family protein